MYTYNFKYTVWFATIEDYGFLCALSGLSDFPSLIEGPKMPRGASSAALRSDPNPPKNSCKSSGRGSVPGDPKRPLISVPEQPVCCLGPLDTPSICGNRHRPLGAAVAAVGPSDPPKARTEEVCHSVHHQAMTTVLEKGGPRARLLIDKQLGAAQRGSTTLQTHITGMYGSTPVGEALAPYFMRWQIRRLH